MSRDRGPARPRKSPEPLVIRDHGAIENSGMLLWARPTAMIMDAIRDMFMPVRCTHCNAIYDAGHVEVTARYLDCSVWISPCCRRTVDSRGRDYTELRR